MKPSTISRKISELQHAVQDLKLAYPNSATCLEIGYAFKALEIHFESHAPLLETLHNAYGAVHALCVTVDTNTTNPLRDQYRADALQYLADLQHALLKFQ